MKILHAVLSLDVGGLERLVVGFVREGVRKGHSVSVMCIERKGAMAEAAKEAGAEVFSLDKPPGRLPAFRKQAAALLRKLRPDVVHTHQIGAAWYMGPGAAELGVPMLHTEHGNHFPKSDGWLTRMKRVLFSRSAAKRIGRFCCVSSEIAASITRLKIAPASKACVVKNGVDLEAFSRLPSKGEARKRFGIPDDAVVLGTVGRLAEIKRQDLLLRAAAELKSRFPSLRVLLIGDGAERTSLERLARELRIDDRCVFAGFLDQPESAFPAMDVFSLTSRSEGFPVSILEAWAAGVPVVSSAVGGIPDIVTDRTLGLLFEPNDRKGLCDAIASLLDDRDRSESIVEAARSMVRAEYSLAQSADRYEREYARLIQSVKGAPVCAS